MKYSVIFLGFLAIIVPNIFAVNYCDPALCPVGQSHVACNNNGDVDPKFCGPNLRIVEPTLMKRIVIRPINEYRNDIAAGFYPLIPPASRMSISVWDDQLANIAQLIVKRCRSKKEDLCISTPTNHNVSSLYFKTDLSATAYPNLDFAKLFEDAMNKWRTSEKFISNEEISRPTDLFLKDSDFAILWNERASRVGCSGLQHRVTSTAVSFITVCLFSAKNYPTEPLYQIGSPVTSCKNGVTPCYPALCSP